MQPGDQIVAGERGSTYDNYKAVGNGRAARRTVSKVENIGHNRHRITFTDGVSFTTPGQTTHPYYPK